MFHEEQRFRQPWLWAIVLLPAAIVIGILAVQVGTGRPVGNHPAPDWLLAVLAVFTGVLLPAFMASLRLTVEVADGVLRIRFFPFVRKEIRLSEIESAEVRTYRPIREYGGWGIRWGGRRGWAYNVSGNRGVQLVLRGGKRLLLGSQKPEALAAALARRV
jgi:hypothetical protein